MKVKDLLVVIRFCSTKDEWIDFCIELIKQTEDWKKEDKEEKP